MRVELIMTIVAAVLGSSALFAFLQFLLQRKDNRRHEADVILHRLDDVSEDVHHLSDKIDKNQATNARIRILQAGDEMRRHVDHSAEYFRQVNEDITLYEKYCEAHPEYKNNQALNTIEYINNIYQKCMAEDSFL